MGTRRIPKNQAQAKSTGGIRCGLSPGVPLQQWTMTANANKSEADTEEREGEGKGPFSSNLRLNNARELWKGNSAELREAGRGPGTMQ